jgi:hypothetical protein
MNDVRLEARMGAVLDGSDRRAAERQPVEIEAKLRELGNTGNEARVLNLSQTGFMAETAAEFTVGARVWLMLPGRDRANAVVRWVEAGRIGAEFAEPIAAVV